jgi:hypothetical protein
MNVTRMLAVEMLAALKACKAAFLDPESCMDWRDLMDQVDEAIANAEASV